MKSTLRASLCAVAVAALGLSILLHRRRWNVPRDELRWGRHIAALFSAWRTRLAAPGLGRQPLASADRGARTQPRPRAEHLDVGESDSGLGWAGPSSDRIFITAARPSPLKRARGLALIEFARTQFARQRLQLGVAFGTEGGGAQRCVFEPLGSAGAVRGGSLNRWAARGPTRHLGATDADDDAGAGAVDAAPVSPTNPSIW